MDQQMNQQFLDQVQDNLPRSLQHKTSQFQQLHLKYSYSGISNSSSSNDFVLTTTRSFNEDWAKLNFVQAQKLFQTLTNKAAELEKRMLISQELILYLLYLYKWNEERLMDVYYEKHAQECQELNRVIRQGETKMHQQSKESVCEVCFIQSSVVVPSTYCTHSYCLDCWHSYIKQNLTHSKIFFPACMSPTCPPHPILLQFIKSLSHPLGQLYRKKICVNYAIINTSVSYCPSDACPLFCQKNMMTQQTTVECLCGVFYCFRCQKQSHQPALCAQVQKWDKLTNQQQSNSEWLRKYTRRCPSCKQDVQKYVGCNYIKSICGQDFCFSCNQKWDQAHKSSPESCVRPKLEGEQTNKNNKEENNNKESNQLQKLVDKVIYLSRCMNADMSIVKKTQQLLTKQQPFSYLKDLFQDLKFRINHAWVSLKWSIITLYLRQKPMIQQQIQKDTLQSIRNLLQTVQKIQKKVHTYSTFSHMLYMDSKELLHLKQELFKRKETMVKTVEVWNEAVKGVVEEY